jgi:DNA-binding beta-propeller fold protein YncE
MRLSLLLLGGLVCLSPACDSPTGPSEVLRAPIDNLFGRPFGIRVAPNGNIFITHLDLALVTRVAGSDHHDRDAAIVGTVPADVVVTPDGETVIVSTLGGGSLFFLDAATWAEKHVTPVGPSAYRLALSASGSEVFVTTSEGMVFRVSVASGQKTDSVTLSGPLNGIARGPDGRIAVSSTGGQITLLDPSTLDVIQAVAGITGAQELAFSGNGVELFVAVESLGAVIILDAQTLVPLDTITFVGDVAVFPFGLAVSPSGDRLIVTSPSTADASGPVPGSIAIIDPLSRKVLKALRVDGSPQRIAFDPTGRTAYVTNDAERVDVIR